MKLIPVDFEILRGLQITHITFTHTLDKKYEDVLTFHIYGPHNFKARTFKMYHDQDCCEHVELIDGLEDLKDIQGIILLAEKIQSPDKNTEESATWTYFKLATIDHSTTLRWYGTSNGYYSEDVDFYEVID